MPANCFKVGLKGSIILRVKYYMQDSVSLRPWSCNVFVVENAGVLLHVVSVMRRYVQILSSVFFIMAINNCISQPKRLYYTACNWCFTNYCCTAAELSPRLT